MTAAAKNRQTFAKAGDIPALIYPKKETTVNVIATKGEDVLNLSIPDGKSPQEMFDVVNTLTALLMLDGASKGKPLSLEAALKTRTEMPVAQAAVYLVEFGVADWCGWHLVLDKQAITK